MTVTSSCLPICLPSWTSPQYLCTVVVGSVVTSTLHPTPCDAVLPDTHFSSLTTPSFCVRKLSAASTYFYTLISTPLSSFPFSNILASLVLSCAHIVFRPKFLCIYFTSKNLLSCWTRLLDSALNFSIIIIISSGLLPGLWLLLLLLHSFDYSFTLLCWLNWLLCPILPTLANADLSDSLFLVASLLGGACHLFS
jgi:hypothetical protein